MPIKLIFFLYLCIEAVLSIYDISKYGAIKDTDTLAAQQINTAAFMKTIMLANSTSPENNERAVRVPKGTYYFMPLTMNKIINVSIVVEGKMSASKILKKWPFKENNKDYRDFISCGQCSNITLSGGGKIDGRGYTWWLLNILNNKKIFPHSNGRPKLVLFQNSHFIKIHDLIMKNSPSFHIKLASCYDVQIYNLNIKVNTTAQIDLFRKFSFVGLVPLFPLNTDGIDPSGARMHIYNISVQNYDDVVVPKPSHEGYYGGNCTEDILVENSTVALGVGMSIGSVPPNQGCNCIRNIIFRNIKMIRPFKGIYVKTNPGEIGTGIIQNIYYQNFTMDRPIWWAIYIGPQQQKQPDGGGPGCMLYPYDPKGTCATQPRVTIRNITLDNIQLHRSLLFPIVIRCNSSNPCQDINFRNVRTDSWVIKPKGKGYVCEEASGKGEGNYPKIDCIDEGYENSLRSSIIDTESDLNINREEILRVLEQMQSAAMQVGYEEEDDEFDYDLDPFKHFGVDRKQQTPSISQI